MPGAPFPGSLDRNCLKKSFANSEMPGSLKNIYWDSNVFISYVNAIPERLSVLEALLEDSARDNGSIRLYTSTLAHTEVAFGISEQQNRRLDPAVEQRIDGLWLDTGTVNSVELQREIALLARGLIRQAVAKGWSLKPPDAIHLATAQWLSSIGLAVEEFHTYDQRLFRYASFVGFDIREPHTRQPRML